LSVSAALRQEQRDTSKNAMNDKRTQLLALYGAMLALLMIGLLLGSDLYIAAIIGLFNAAIFLIYRQMYPAVNSTMGLSGKPIVTTIFIILLACSFAGFVIAYFIFDNVAVAGMMLGMAVACAHTLISKDVA